MHEYLNVSGDKRLPVSWLESFDMEISGSDRCVFCLCVTSLQYRLVATNTAVQVTTAIPRHASYSFPCSSKGRPVILTENNKQCRSGLSV